MKDEIREALAFEDLTQEEKDRRGILCRLYGPCADISGPTRNGRKYSDELWETVFNKNEIVKELLANGGIPGEAQHPADREEIDTEKIALMMPEAPKRDKNNHLIAYYDVLDTPCGRILYQLAKYGFKLGISSRGTGDLITDENGDECVDPSTYDFTCFDAVIIPSVKDARLSMVESLDKNSMSLKQALKESLDKANESDKKIMTEALKDLNIEIEEEEEEKKEELPEEKECNSEDCADKLEENSEKDLEEKEAINDGAQEIIESLKEALKIKSKYEIIIKQLRESLAVSNTKVSELEEENNKNKATVERLTTSVRESKEKLKRIAELESELEKKENKIKTLESFNKNRTNKLNATIKTLRESITTKSLDNEKIATESKNLKESYDNKINALNEELKQVRESTSKKVDTLNNEVKKYKTLSENYKNKTYKIVEKYIESKANLLGVSATEIKNRLGESYTLSDIDNICENFRDYTIRMNNLPFKVDKKSVVKIKESVTNNPILKQSMEVMSEDDCDSEALLRVAG